MKKFFSACLLLLALGFSFAQIPNAGFELWDNQPVPLQWETNSRPLTAPAWEPYIVRQDTDRYSGNYAANFWSNGFFKPFAKTTFPITAHPQSLSLYYKLSFAPCVNDPGFPQKDTVSVLVEILNNGAVVDQGYWERTSTSFNYSQLVIPVSQNATVFDSCRITIYGGTNFGGCGIIAARTEFKVDELNLSYPNQTGCIDSLQICDTCICSTAYHPVCGCDGNTYGNACEAENAGVTNWAVGACPQPMDSCIHRGVLTMGLCILISDFATGAGLYPCTFPVWPQGMTWDVGDTVIYNYTPGSCFTSCMQGTDVNLTCLYNLSDTSQPNLCNMTVSLSVHHPTSHIAANGHIIATVTGATPPLVYVWHPGGGSADSIGGLSNGTYCLTVTDVNGCTATACATLNGPNVCIDSALICETGSLCCDAPLQMPVCGCDSVTYMNACIATLWHGVTSYTQGACPTGSDTCNAFFSVNVRGDTVEFINGSTATSNIQFWSYDVGNAWVIQLSDTSYIFLQPGTHTVCLSIFSSSGCQDNYCQGIFIQPHSCVDTLLIDNQPCAAIYSPVCGCDSMTYANECEAQRWYGVTGYYDGECITTGIRNNSSSPPYMAVFPNPASNVLQVSYETLRPGKTEMRITNMLGQEVVSLSRVYEVAGMHLADVNVSHLTAGIYFLEIKTESGRRVRKFMVE